MTPAGTPVTGRCFLDEVSSRCSVDIPASLTTNAIVRPSLDSSKPSTSHEKSVVTGVKLPRRSRYPRRVKSLSLSERTHTPRPSRLNCPSDQEICADGSVIGSFWPDAAFTSHSVLLVIDTYSWTSSRESSGDQSSGCQPPPV